jgi:macrolide-specific efflux system membrane fusion protein
MFHTAIILSLTCFLSAGSNDGLPASKTIPNCQIEFEDEAEVPAQEAGVLMELPVKEGDQVRIGDLLAKIDDSLPRMEAVVAENKWKVDDVKAKNEANINFAKAAAAVAESVCMRDKKSNERMAGSVTDADVETHKLDHIKAVLQIEVSEMEKTIAKYSCNVSKSEWDAANEKIERRRIKSPLDGQVQKISRHLGEWVMAGDTVLKVVRINKLRTDGYLKISEFAPEEIINRPVTIKIELARGRSSSFEGKIVFVDPIVVNGNEYLVRAEIQNREENGQWLLRAGMNAEMTIHLK